MKLESVNPCVYVDRLIWIYIQEQQIGEISYHIFII